MFACIFHLFHLMQKTEKSEKVIEKKEDSKVVMYSTKQYVWWTSKCLKTFQLLQHQVLKIYAEAMLLLTIINLLNVASKVCSTCNEL